MRVDESGGEDFKMFVEENLHILHHYRQQKCHVFPLHCLLLRLTFSVVFFQEVKQAGAEPKTEL